MSDNEIKVKITGDASGAEAAMNKGTAAVTTGTKQMQDSMGGLNSVFDTLKSKMLMIGAALAGGAIFNASIEKVQELNSEAVSLANALGISAEEANILNTALGNVFVDKETYLDATKKLTQMLNTNESAFRQLGVATRDSNNQLLPMQQIVTQSVAALKEFKAGTDRNTMAQQLFGRSYQDVINLARLTPEVMADAANEVADYNKQLDPAASLRYKQAMENVGDVIEGLQVAIANAVMPVLSELAEWFSSIGPSVVAIFSEAIDLLVIAFDAVKAVVTTVYDVVSSFIDFFLAGISKAFGTEQISKVELFTNAIKVVELAFLALGYGIEQAVNIISGHLDVAKTVVMTFANVASHALKGDFAGAKQAWKEGMAEIEAVIIEHTQNVAEINEKYAAKANEVIFPTTKKPASTESSEVISGGTKGSFAIENTDSKAADEEKKIQAAKLKAKREAQKEAEAIAQVEIARTKASAEAKLAIDEDNARAALDLGRISNEQYLEQMEAFENRRYEIAKAALQARMELVLADPNSSPSERARINAEMEALDADHARKLNQVNIERTQESMKLWNDLSASMSGLWDKGLEAMMNGTLKWSNAYKAVLVEVGRVFANFAMQKAKTWLTSEVLQTAYTKVQILMRSALERMGLLQSTAATAQAATVKVGANAAVAGSGAASAMASIPYIGPILAIAAMAAMLASVGGLKGSIKSARGGYDIPAGVNPMVQLHEQEMVLPKAQANAVRDMATNGVGGRGDTFNLNISAVDGESVRKMFLDNSHHIGAAVKSYARNGGAMS
jgi:hypothetical protein